MTYLNPFFIGIAGPDKVGKSTVQRAIQELDWRTIGHPHADIIVRPMSFATRLYAALSAMFGVSVEDIKARKEEVFTAKTAPHPTLIGKSWRQILRNFATEYVRDDLSNEHWVDCVLRDAPKIEQFDYARHLIVVIDDLRFVNEVGICDLVVELYKDGASYSTAHRSAQGLPRELIDNSIVNQEGKPGAAAEIIAVLARERFEKHDFYHRTDILRWLDLHIDDAHGDILDLTVRDERRLEAHHINEENFMGLRHAVAGAGGVYKGLQVCFGAPDTAVRQKPTAPKVA